MSRAVPTVGQEAVVAVAVATMWVAPDVVRPIDALAIADVPDIRAWVSGMTVADLEDLDGRTLTQLLLGERVQVESIADGWAEVVAVEQPAAKLDTRGYPGYVRLAHLAPPVPAPAGGRAVMVDAAATALRDEPNGDVVLPGVVVGTRLPVTGRTERGWVPVLVPGPAPEAWAREADVVPVPTGPPSAKEVLAVADRLIDVPYVWGGLSAYGIDCSGLVHLAHRRLGVTVPRDADDQADASEPLPMGQEQPGDLYFFARDGKPVHHVGIVASSAEGTEEDPRQLLHAAGQDAAGRVVREDMPPERTRTLAGAHRVLS